MRIFNVLFAAAIGLFADCSFAAAQDVSPLALQAKAVVERHCFACHGGGAVAASNLNLLDPASFRFDQDRDNILEMITSDEMPPAEHTSLYEKRCGVTAARLAQMQLSASTRKTLVDWLTADAPSWGSGVVERPFLSYELLRKIDRRDSGRPRKFA